MLADLWKGMVLTEGSFVARGEELYQAMMFIRNYFPNAAYKIENIGSGMHWKFTVQPPAPKPIAIVLVWEVGLLVSEPFMAIIVYSDKELKEVVNRWTNGKYRVTWMDAGFHKKEPTIPFELVSDIWAAYDEACNNLPTNYEIKATSFEEAVIEVLEHNPEGSVSEWLIQEIRKFQKKEK